ncbi:MAG: translation initiation factor IF-1 [Akkermansiaceae bacterium]|jgi:translation initiation factor IF-1
MPETPITTIGKIHDLLTDGVFNVELANGKLVVGHLPRRLVEFVGPLATGDLVALEMTPYDFEKARIVGRAPQS